MAWYRLRRPFFFLFFLPGAPLNALLPQRPFVCPSLCLRQKPQIATIIQTCPEQFSHDVLKSVRCNVHVRRPRFGRLFRPIHARIAQSTFFVLPPPSAAVAAAPRPPPSAVVAAALRPPAAAAVAAALWPPAAAAVSRRRALLACAVVFLGRVCCHLLHLLRPSSSSSAVFIFLGCVFIFLGCVFIFLGCGGHLDGVRCCFIRAAPS